LAQVIPEDEIRFAEESAQPLSDRDRDLFLSLLENPPPPNQSLQEANRAPLAQRGGMACRFPISPTGA